ncbi:MAG: response regulator [Desulfatibacillaceae bacterium]
MARKPTYEQLADRVRQLEKRMAEARRMEAFGTLARGIVHEFNNVLGIIMGYAELGARRTAGDHPARGYFTEVLNGTRRARGLVAQIRSFSSAGQLGKRPLEVGVVAKETVKLLRDSLPANVQAEVEVDDEAGSVMADLAGLHQALMMLCSGMAGEMSGEGGLFSVAVAPCVVEASDETDKGPPPGRYVHISLVDQGPVRDSDDTGEDSDGIFDSQGHEIPDTLPDLESSIEFVRDILRQHNGFLIITGDAGGRRIVDVYLPRVDDGGLPDITATDLPGGNERVLLVDDEPELLEAGRQMLVDLGYRVTTAATGREALDLFRETPDNFAAVITDRTMPIMPGERLARQVLRIRPGVPVVMCTGHSDLLDAEAASALGLAAFLNKPLSMRDLAHTVREVLDR